MSNKNNTNVHKNADCGNDEESQLLDRDLYREKHVASYPSVVTQVILACVVYVALGDLVAASLWWSWSTQLSLMEEMNLTVIRDEMGSCDPSDSLGGVTIAVKYLTISIGCLLVGFFLDGRNRKYIHPRTLWAFKSTITLSICVVSLFIMLVMMFPLKYASYNGPLRDSCDAVARANYLNCAYVHDVSVIVAGISSTTLVSFETIGGDGYLRNLCVHIFSHRSTLLAVIVTTITYFGILFALMLE